MQASCGQDNSVAGRGLGRGLRHTKIAGRGLGCDKNAGRGAGLRFEFRPVCNSDPALYLCETFDILVSPIGAFEVETPATKTVCNYHSTVQPLSVGEYGTGEIGIAPQHDQEDSIG